MVALPFHISQYLSALWDEAAALLDVDASFYRRLSWRICTGEFPLSSEICGSFGIDSPPHWPRVLCGSSPHHREGLGGRPRDGKTAVCGAARGKETSVWISSIRTSGRRRSVVQRDQCVAKKWLQQENRRPFPSGVKPSAYPSFSCATKSAALRHDAKTRVEGGRASPKAYS
ncbi:hypothetical protein TcCL_NonESM08510 [Trypanosoma cruzi]|nr:hypothetical protein TcCL_NonESM08510 [Trypanosoma cruzi]